MSFAPDWLRLREPVDHRSRSSALLARLADRFRGRREIAVVDLGAGLGSNLRACAPALPAQQRWILVDHDPALLAAAPEAIAAWADTARRTESGVEAVKAGRTLHVQMRRHDLAADPAPWSDAQPDLVTAAALFDLVSEAWIGRFAAALRASGAAFYTALTHDGTTDWQPPHAADTAVLAAFELHFARDKGFGPAAGGQASRHLAACLAAAGYAVEQAPSPWKLGPDDRALIGALARGWADAVRDTGRVPASTLNDWLAARTRDGVRCTVGHEDLLAFPR